MDTSPQNPIAKKSQKWLIDALLRLMNNDDFHKITIKQIAKEAEVDRSTFYRNFKKKEDILNLHLQKIAEQYIRILSKEEDLSMQKQAAIFFKFFNHNSDLIFLLRRHGLTNLLLDTFNKNIPYLHNITKEKFPENINEDYLKFALAFNAGGMWNILIQWIDDGLKHPYTDLIKAFNDISLFNSAIIEKDD